MPSNCGHSNLPLSASLTHTHTHTQHVCRHARTHVRIHTHTTRACTHTHTHNTHACMHTHTVYSKTRLTVQYMLEADWTLNYLLFEVQLLSSSCHTGLSTTTQVYLYFLQHYCFIMHTNIFWLYIYIDI